ncbi:MAG: RNA polymerase subunit sigma-70 [Acidobacteria bacterium]|nr:MAG: RNA polymerase subunit sigma-70 [Acidobacteriota bacterium]
MGSIPRDSDSMDRAIQPAADAPPELATIAGELHAKCAAEQFGLSCDDLARILGEVTKKYFGAAGQAQLRVFCTSLKIEELVLARACAAGNERAWEVFMVRYREKLYDIGLHIAREDSAARELSDSLYADLYGTVIRNGERVSKLSSYTGRGSLEGWLRTVMAQEHVNRYRRQKRMVSLDEETEEGAQFATTDPEPAQAVDARLESVTDEALGALAADERFILAAYYLDGRTLAEIARMLSVHESTISRKLDKVVKSLRKQVVAGLARKGMSRRQAEEALAIDVRDITLNLRDRLAQDSSPEAFHKKKVATPAGDESG